MQRVPRPVHPPHVCALTLRGEDPDGFFTTNTEIRGLDPKAYICASVVRDMARDLGWFSGEQYAGVVAELEQHERTIDDLRQQLAEADRQLDAIDVLESANYTARKKPGRPKTRQEA